MRMRRRNEWYRWMLAGTILGAVGMGMTQMSFPNMKKMRRNAAVMTSRAAKQAGRAITNMGTDLANRIR